MRTVWPLIWARMRLRSVDDIERYIDDFGLTAGEGRGANLDAALGDSLATGGSTAVYAVM